MRRCYSWTTVRERLLILSLDPEGYVQMLKEAALTCIVGGAIYDAIAVQCGLKAKAQIIYTWDVKELNRLGGGGR